MVDKKTLSDWSNFVRQHFCRYCTCGDEDCYMDAVLPEKSDCPLAEQFAKLFELDQRINEIECSDCEDEHTEKLYQRYEMEFWSLYRWLDNAVADLYPEPPEETRHYYCNRQCYSA